MNDSQAALSYGFPLRLMLIAMVLFQQLGVVNGSILHAAVGVMHQSGQQPPLDQRHAQRRDR